MINELKSINKIRIFVGDRLMIMKTEYHFIKKKDRGGIPERFINLVINSSFVEREIFIQEVGVILLILIK